MSALLSKKLRLFISNGQRCLWFWCPGCKEVHVAQLDPPGPTWNWNGDADKPVFSPSILRTSGHYLTSHEPGKPCWCTFNEEHPKRASFKCLRCHSFVGCNGAQPGQITFLADSSHELAGKTVDLPDLPECLQYQTDED